MLDLDLLTQEYAVCRLPAGTALPPSLGAAVDDASVVSVTWAPDETSIICPADQVPEGATAETPWRCLRVIGPLDLAMTGVLASLVGPLADARVNIVTFSTFDTDYLLVPSVRLTEAMDTLTAAGHRIAR
ncbi:ACT domain-containing protein [Mangrovihabitans endophyticus]|uniref:Amino acid-binding protein n=1 Tax=Mangrovihabitans endophyticus TaxID=1751298 RepID=A0A8J3BYT6_9ACTN|nr:ACT domain-containing protein [Mangrovihabitans endophyticus]GGK93789.1 amino acid-binding protein [Mangrovihabitans endophyticus]